MAVYYLNLKTFGRSGGSSAVDAAAYRSGERIRDERTGRTYDHTERRDVMHREILLPGDLAAHDTGWALERAQLWNAAESAESRKNARVAREYLVALPVELTHPQRVDLVRGFSRELVERYRFALDLTVHAPRDLPGSDPRNFHAHLLATTREVIAAGLAAKTTLELNDSKRRELGLPPAVHELFFVRERWATVTNEALRDAQIAARVDHRTLAAQGIDREPYPHISHAAFEMERHGYRSGEAERVRSNYEARVQARMQAGMERNAELAARAAATAATSAAASTSASTTASTTAGTAAGNSVEAATKPQTLEDIRRQAREDWLRMRQESTRESAKGAATRAALEHADDDHFSR